METDTTEGENKEKTEVKPAKTEKDLVKFIHIIKCSIKDYQKE